MDETMTTSTKLKPLLLVGLASAASVLVIKTAQIVFPKKNWLWNIFLSLKSYFDSNESGQDDKGLGPPLDSARYGGITLSGKKDQIYRKNDGPFPFMFNAEVSNVFDDMVSRSVPLYREVNDFMLYWLHRYYVKDTAIVDLGCSTGTAFDLICRSFEDSKLVLNLVGVDNSAAMIEKCNQKILWAKKKHKVFLRQSDMLDFQLEPLKLRASFVILNYTLQFLKFQERERLVKNIYRWLLPGGVIFVSEKLMYKDPDMQKTVRYIYEDFKSRRGYSNTEIARKKEALMNVLVPYTEESLKLVLKTTGFEEVNVAIKWNNFATLTARKPYFTDKAIKVSTTKKKVKINPMDVKYLEALFDYHGEYISGTFELEQFDLVRLLKIRQKMMEVKGNFNKDTLVFFNRVSKKIIQLQDYISFDTSGELGKFQIINLDTDTEVTSIAPREQGYSFAEFSESQLEMPEDGILDLCDASDFLPGKADSAKKHLDKLVQLLMPWKKGPLRICNKLIDAEWRSDLKWKRLTPWIPNLGNKVVCDIGCNNGYFMFRMLTENQETCPKLVVGVEPSLNCFLQFQLMSKLSRSPFKSRLKFEYAYADVLEYWKRSFDVIFCLGVLYHTTDPIKMLRDIHAALKPRGLVYIDCQGVSLEHNEDQPICIFPKKKYANMKGVYFLPNLTALKYWLSRSSFKDITVIFSEKLSTKEQRITKHAPVNTSLKESLNPQDKAQTIEGYPAPYRFYIRARKG